MINPLFRFLLLGAFALFIGLVPRNGVGQALLGFRPTTLSVTQYFLPPHAPLAAAYHAALDSLSQRYGIPVDTQRTYHHSFTLEGRVNYTPNLNSPGYFQYTHTAVLRDAAGQREVFRVESKLLNLVDLARHPSALRRSFGQTYDPLFRFLARYGTPVTPAPGPVLRLVFESPPAHGTQVQQVVAEVFARNQGKLGYHLADAHPATGPEHVIRIMLAAASPSGLTVTWRLDSKENAQYQGKPIPTTFAVSAADLNRGDFSYLMAKMTASLIKLREESW